MPTDATSGTSPLPQSGTFTPPPPDSAAPPSTPRPDQGPSAAPPQAAPPRGPTPYSGPREPYLPLVRNRPIEQMGTDDWVTAGLRKYPRGAVPQGPWVPQPQDVNQLTHQISSGLGRIGSGITGPMALAFGGARSGYLKSFLQGRQVAMQMYKEQHDMIAVQLEEQLGKEQAAIAEIVAYYKDKPKRAEEMWARLREAAYGTSDKTLLQAINEQNSPGLERVMQARDGYHQSLAKLNEMRTKTAADQARAENERQKAQAAAELQKQRSATLTSLGINPSVLPPPIPPPDASTETPGPAEEPAAAAPGTSAPSSAPSSTTTDQEDEGLPAPGLLGGPRTELQQPANPGTSPLAAAQGGGGEQGAPALGLGLPQTAEADPENAPPYQVAGPAMPPPSQPQQVAQQQPAPQIQPTPGAPQPSTASPQIRRWAHQQLMGQKPDFGSDKTLANIIRPYVDREATTLSTQLNGIINDPRYARLPPEIRQDAVLAAVRAIDPDMARDAQNLIFGGRVPSAREAAKEGFQLVFSLARQADPSFDVNTVNTRASVMRSFASGQDARSLTSMATSEHHLNSLLEAAAQLRSDPSPERVGRFLDRWLPDSKYGNAVKNWYHDSLGTGKDPQMLALTAYNAVVHMVAPEIARAVKGAAPTKAEIEGVEGDFSANRPVEALRVIANRDRELIRARLGELKRRYLEGVGNNPKLGIERLFTVQTSQGEFGQNSAAPEGTVQSPLVPMPPGYNYGAALQQIGAAATTGPTTGSRPPLRPGWSIE